MLQKDPISYGAADLSGTDWSCTALGPVCTWSERLRAVVDVLLRHAEPACLFWGPEGTMVHNAAWAEGVGPLGRSFMGSPARWVSPALGSACEEALRRASEGGTPDIGPDLLPLMWRCLADRPFAMLSCTPVPDAEGRALGLLVLLSAAPPGRGSTGAASGRSRRDAFLLRLGAALRQIGEPGAVTATGTRMTGEELGADGACLVEIDADAGLARQCGAWRRDGAAPEAGVTHALAACGPALERLRRGLPLIRADADGDGEGSLAPDGTALPGTGFAGTALPALLVVPIHRGDALAALLCVGRDRPHRWSADEIATMHEAGLYLWDAQDCARTQAALRLGEAERRTVFDSIDEGLCLYERLPAGPDGRSDFRVVAMNPAIQAMFGIPDLVGRSIRDGFPGGDEDWCALSDRVLATGEPARLLRGPEPGGMALEITVSRVEDADGRMLLAVVQDASHGGPAGQAPHETGARHAILTELSDALRPIGDAGQAEAAAMRVLGRHFGATRAAYFEADPSGETVTARGRYVDGAEPLTATIRLADFGPRPAEAYAAGRTFVVHDTAELPHGAAERTAFEAAGIRSAVGVPVVKDGRFVALLAVGNRAPHRWTPADLALIEETAERIWEAQQRAQAEAALRRSEARLRAFVTATSDALYRMSPDWREMRHVDGHGFLRDTSEPIADWLSAYVHPADHDAVRAAIRKAVETRGIFELEHRVRRADGALGWTHSRAVPLTDANGEIVEWFGTASDVTERRDSEDAVRHTETRLRVAQAAADVGTFDWLIDSNEGLWSIELLSMMGLQEGALGGRFEDWVALVHPEDLPHASQEIEAALETGVLDGEWRVVRPDGAVMWVLVRGVVERDALGRPTRLTGAQVDITARIQSEQRVRWLIAELDTQIEQLKSQLRRDGF